MTYDEYKDTLNNLTKEYNYQVNRLKMEYIINNSKYKIGDIVEDHIGKLKIEKIRIWKELNGEIGCVYVGIDLKKDNTPKKKSNRTMCFSSNVKGGWKK